MTEENIYDRLTKVFRDIFDIENISLNHLTTAADIQGWDSLSHVILIVAIEKEFKMKFNISEMTNMNNLGEMLQIIQGRDN